MKVRNMSLAGVLGGLIVAGSALAAAGQSSGPVPASARGPVEQASGTGGSERSQGYPGKPRPPVEVTLVPGASLESGVPGLLVLQVRSTAPLEGLGLDVTGDAGLTVVGPPRAVAAPSIEAPAATEGARARFEVSITPTSGGSRHISGLATYRVDGVMQAAPFNLTLDVGGPVTVPATSRKPERVPVRDSTGELVDSMPAETTVR
jgi:hypothetical protein